MNKNIKYLIDKNKNLKSEIKDATFSLKKEIKENNSIIKCLKELSKLFGQDSIICNFQNSVNSDSELLKDYKLNIPVNTNGVKYKLNTIFEDYISYIFYYNIKGKLILVEEYDIYEDTCYWMDNKIFDRLSAYISDYSIFSTRKVIENKILKRINNCLNKISDHCIKNLIPLENSPRIKFSGYNEEFFSDYQEKYFKTLALFE